MCKVMGAHSGDECCSDGVCLLVLDEPNLVCELEKRSIKGGKASLIMSSGSAS